MAEIMTEKPASIQQTVGKVVLGWVNLLVFFVVLAVLFWIGRGLYTGSHIGFNALRNQGYLPHQRDTAVFATDNWIQGKYHNCSKTLLASDSSTEKIEPALACGDGTGYTRHVLPVTFKGQFTSGEDKTALWRCQREEKSLTCSMK